MASMFPSSLRAERSKARRLLRKGTKPKRADYRLPEEKRPNEGWEVVSSGRTATLQDVFESEISPFEYSSAQLALEKHTSLEPHAYTVDLDRDQLTIYTMESGDLFLQLLGLQSVQPGATDLVRRYGSYTASLRFVVADAERREFMAQRFCYEDSDQGWISLKSGKLNDLLKNYLPHLGKTSFYELR